MIQLEFEDAGESTDDVGTTTSTSTSVGPGPSSSTTTSTTVPPATSTVTTVVPSTGPDDPTDDTTDTSPPEPQDCAPRAGWNWQTELSGPFDGNDQGNAIIPFGDGVVVLLSLVAQPDEVQQPHLRHHLWGGLMQWQSGGPIGVRGQDVVAVPGDDLVACGYRDDPGPDLWLGRFAPDGGQLWSQTHPLGRCFALAPGIFGTVIVGGTNEFDQATVFRFDDQGNPLSQWSPTEPAITGGILDVAAIDTHVVLLADAGPSGYWLGRLDDADQLLWSQVFEIPGTPLEANGVVVDPSGDILVAGWADAGTATDRDVMVWRYSPDGDLLWGRDHDISGDDDEAEAIAITPEGDLAITGFRANPGTGWDVMIAMLTADGDLLWSDDWPVGGQDRGTDIAADDCGGVAVTGLVWSASDLDAWIGRYAP